jgi:hypothetical protein
MIHVFVSITRKFQYILYNIKKTNDIYKSRAKVGVISDSLTISDSIPDTRRIYINILYPKIFKQDISFPFLEQDISKYHIHILSYILFSTFSAQDFSFSTAVPAISAVICHFLAVLLIDQGFNSIR